MDFGRADAILFGIHSLPRLLVRPTVTHPHHPLPTPVQSASSPAAAADDPALVSAYQRPSQPLRHHRYSLPAASVQSLPRCAPLARPLDRDRRRVSETFLVAQKSPTASLADRRGKPVPTLVGCAAPDRAEDSADDKRTSDVADYFATRRRPNAMAAMRRALESAELHASSPVNSTGVHIVIDDEKNDDDVTCSDDVTVSVGDGDS